MSDSRLDIEKQKLLEYREHLREAMEDACKDCDSHKTLGCDWYDPEEETFDFVECFRVRGL